MDIDEIYFYFLLNLFTYTKQRVKVPICLTICFDNIYERVNQSVMQVET